MLKFICAEKYIENGGQISFNTSHVEVHQPLFFLPLFQFLVSIHLMLKFIFSIESSILDIKECFNTSHVEVHRNTKRERSNNIVRFNTSHVEVHLVVKAIVRTFGSRFNTSHVEVHHLNIMELSKQDFFSFNTSHVEVHQNLI